MSGGPLCASGSPEFLLGKLGHGLVVGLAVGGPEGNGCADQDAFGRLVACKLVAHMGTQRFLVECRARRKLDDAGDRLTPFFVGYAYHKSILDPGMRLQGFLDFFRIDLFSRRVDAGRAAAKQRQRAVGFDQAPVTRNRVAFAAHGLEGLGAFSGSL